MLSSKELATWLAVWRIVGIGPITYAKLLTHFPHFVGLFDADAAYLNKLGLNSSLIAALQQPDWAAVEHDLTWAQQQGCHILTLADAAYPILLKQIAAAPPILFVQGNISVLDSTQLALVGSRNPTSVGKETAYQFAYCLAEQDITITSGLALGIDTASHSGALAAQGKTIAVMATGMDSIYPAQHRKLAEQVIEQGALISEFPLGVGVKSGHFPQRNRIISGLSLGVLVVEAALKSGSLITARYALEQNREIFAIPGSIHNPLSKGCHALIQQGAKLVETTADILEELTILRAMNSSKPTRIATATAPESMSEHTTLLTHIDYAATPVDLIVQRSGLTVEAVSSMLLLLELDNYVAAIPGGYIRIMTCPI